MQEKTHKGMIPFHPLLFALYAPIALLASNILQIRPVDSIRSIVVFFLLGIFVYLLFRITLKDWPWAAMFSSVLILLFFSYGQVYTALNPVVILGDTVGRHRYLVPAWFVISALAIWGLSRLRQNLVTTTNVMNISSIALIVLPVYQLINNTIMTLRNEKTNAASVSTITLNGQNTTTEKPDVYYIILDMYGRDDVLQDRFQYNNSEFLKSLEELGFVVTRCSVSNYNMTELSLASSFNMNYLDTLGSQYKAGNTDRSGLPSLIHHSAVRKIFENMGYRFINFETGFTFTEIRDADEFLVPPDSDPETGKTISRLNEFESLLLKTTAFVIVSDAQTKWLHPITDALDMRREHIVREMYLLDKLPKLATEKSPKFVYAHILIPHPPFVFTKDGVDLTFPTSYRPDDEEPTATKDYAIGYRHQLDYINLRLIPILKEIIDNSKTPPVIIVQGDHGVDPKRSFILNAYYLPGGTREKIWQTISPVNTFRVIYNSYFQDKFDILPDINYASKAKRPYDYEVIENKRICQ
jgi:hypothetical protein